MKIAGMTFVLLSAIARHCHPSMGLAPGEIRGGRETKTAWNGTHPIGIPARPGLRTARECPWGTLARTARSPGAYRASGEAILPRTSNRPLDFRGRVRIYGLFATALGSAWFPLHRLLGIRAVDRRLLRGRRGHRHLHASVVLEVGGIGHVLGMLLVLLVLDVCMLLFWGALCAQRLGREGAGETVHRVRVVHRPRWVVCAWWSASVAIVVGGWGEDVAGERGR